MNLWRSTPGNPRGLSELSNVKENTWNTELEMYLEEIHRKLQATYERAQADSVQTPKGRRLADTGSAGSEGESSWKSILEQWLPPSFPVVNGGRILMENGNLSHQVDLLVLSPNYPKALLETDRYFSTGVLAAFECKLTLRKQGLQKTIRNAAELAQSFGPVSRCKNLRDALFSPILYGLLAHSHDFRKEPKLQEAGFTLLKETQNICRHPREVLDVVCIGDLATWGVHKELHSYELIGQQRLNRDHFVLAGFERQMKPGFISQDIGASPSVTPAGSLLTAVCRRLSWGRPEVSDLANLLARGTSAGSRQMPFHLFEEQHPKELLGDDIWNTLKFNHYRQESHVQKSTDDVLPWALSHSLLGRD